jgi:hypothetical protein
VAAIIDYFRRETPVCPICFDDLSGDIKFHLANANGHRVLHQFHENCLNNWLGGGHDTCPNCNEHRPAWQRIESLQSRIEDGVWAVKDLSSRTVSATCSCMASSVVRIGRAIRSRLCPLSPEQRRERLLKLCRACHPLNEIEPLNSLSEVDRGAAVLACVEKLYVEGINQLLDSGPITNEDRDESILDLIEFHELPATDRTSAMLRALILSGQISQRSLASCLLYAMQFMKRDQVIINRLMDHADRLNDSNRGLLVWTSIAHGFGDLMVPSLLASGAIEPQMRDLAVIRAAERNNVNMIQLLLANGPVSENARTQALSEAQNHGFLDIAALLRPN